MPVHVGDFKRYILLLLWVNYPNYPNMGSSFKMCQGSINVNNQHNKYTHIYEYNFVFQWLNFPPALFLFQRDRIIILIVEDLFPSL